MLVAVLRPGSVSQNLLILDPSASSGSLQLRKEDAAEENVQRVLPYTSHFLSRLTYNYGTPTYTPHRTNRSHASPSSSRTDEPVYQQHQDSISPERGTELAADVSRRCVAAGIGTLNSVD